MNEMVKRHYEYAIKVDNTSGKYVLNSDLIRYNWDCTKEWKDREGKTIEEIDIIDHFRSAYSFPNRERSDVDMLGSIRFDIDGHDRPLEEALAEAKKLLNILHDTFHIEYEGIHLYFTGRGFKLRNLGGRSLIY